MTSKEVWNERYLRAKDNKRIWFTLEYLNGINTRFTIDFIPESEKHLEPFMSMLRKRTFHTANHFFIKWAKACAVIKVKLDSTQ